jgi:hypothetical protein
MSDRTRSSIAGPGRRPKRLDLPLSRWLPHGSGCALVATRPSDQVWLTRIDYTAAAAFLLGLIAGVGVLLYAMLCHPSC